MAPQGPPEVSALLQRSNRLGSDPRNTNYAGGNTSAKGQAADPVTGRSVEVLWVKGSGGDLGTLTEAGLAVLRLDRLRALPGVYPGVGREDEMVAAFDYCRHGAGGPAPSIDTAMHGLLDLPHVDHLHPDSGIALAAAADGEALTRACFGDRVGWLPWRRPGFQLGLDIAAFQRASPAAIGVILGGHGITAWGASSTECEANSLEIIATAQRYLDETGRPEPFGPAISGYQPLPAAQRRERAAGLAPVLRGLASTDHPQVGHFSDSDVVLGFLASSRHAELAALGTSCPDHFLRTKIAPLVLDLPPSAPFDVIRSRLEELHRAYRDNYRAYYERHAGPSSPPMRGADPAIVLVPGIGMFSYGADKQTARVAGEFYVNAINVMRGAESVSAYAPISEAEKFRIEYWDLEEAKLRRRPKPRPLASRIALVTGGGSGIGRATARRLAAEGACVVVADRDGDAARQVAAGIGSADVAVGVTSDVTDESAVAGAFQAAALAFGGADLVVNNAGPVHLPAAAGDHRGRLGHPARRDGQGIVPGLPGGRARHGRAGHGRRHHLHLQQEFRRGRPGQRRLRRGQGRSGAPGPAAGRRARRARHPGQRHQSGRCRPRLRNLRRRLGRAAGGRLRRARGGTRRVLRPADAAQAGDTARARGRRRGGADRGGPAGHDRPAHPG